MTVAAATPSSSTLACHLRVYGLVQGVYYRHSTIQQAQRLGLHGWVRNRSDGSVEALVHGPADAVQTLIDWAHQGPEAARVERVQVSPAAAEELATLAPGFVQRETL